MLSKKFPTWLLAAAIWQAQNLAARDAFSMQDAPAGYKSSLILGDAVAMDSEVVPAQEAMEFPGLYTSPEVPAPSVFPGSMVPNLPKNGYLPVAKTNEESAVAFGDWLGYNPTQADSTWLAGNGDDFGIFSLESFPALDMGKDSSLMLGMSMHFLNGPVTTDMPPRLFDFQSAYQYRKPAGPNLILDTRAGIGAFSDFEGSARKGIRFPGHAVAYYQWHAWLVSVLGIEVLDRDDINVLPVVGMVWRPRDDIVAELVFPRPRLQVRTGKNRALYINGELGGGTWAIERVDAGNDNATYRDIRVMIGMMDFGSQDRSESVMEIGWAFARALEYRSGIGNYHPEDTFILRFRQHY